MPVVMMVLWGWRGWAEIIEAGLEHTLVERNKEIKTLRERDREERERERERESQAIE